MEAAAAVARRAGLLARAWPGSRARAGARAWERGVGSAPPAARRRLLAASLGAGEPIPAQSLGEEAVALEVREDEYEASSIISSETLPPPNANEIAAVPQAKTVCVKFVLKKQCAFGQQFLVVGDDPALGLWDPSKATELDWSEDHVWTATTDLPANRLIEFKFLLREASGHIRWLHGANRTLQTTETTNTLVVHEDWDHAKKQSVYEEEELSIGAEEAIFPEDLAGSNGAMQADNIITDEYLGHESEAVIADAPQQGEIMVADETVEADAPQQGGMMVADETVEADAPQQGGMMVADETDQPQLVLDKDETVLEELHEEVKTVAQNGSNGNDTTFCQEGALLANRPTSILENDLAWAGKAMQQVLRILGFQIGTTKT